MLGIPPVRVFVSYKSEDGLFAREVRDMLRAWGYETWLDQDDIPAGIGRDSAGWMQAILNGIKASQVMVGLLAKESLESPFVLGEWQSARDNGLHLFHLQIREVKPGDIPPPFNLSQRIDCVKNADQGLHQLKERLDFFTHNIVSKTTHFTTAENVPSAKPPTRRPAWQSSLRVLAALSFIVSLLWLIVAPSFEPLMAFLGAVTALLITLYESDQTIGGRNPLTNRQKMLERVQTSWIEGVLYTALRDVKKLHINLVSKPDAVLKHQDFGDFELGDSQNVPVIFNTMKSFLILGEPGAGKTIMLLQLAESLLHAARQDERRPIPVVFNLSSWAQDQKALVEWLLDELQRDYQVRRTIGKRWLDNGDLVLLLDGLDEVKEEVRTACVQAINTFRRKYAAIQMVVCSRIRDYEKLSAQLDLKGSIVLQGLSEAQINLYLQDPALSSLRKVIADDATLREMTAVPFLLNTMVYAYAHETEHALRGYDSPAARRRHLFETYIYKRLREKPSPYTYNQTMAYLEWLATKMQGYVQTIFRVEAIQPYWLGSDNFSLRLFRSLVIIIICSLLAFSWAMPGALAGGYIGALFFGGAGIFLGLAVLRDLFNVPIIEIKTKRSLNLVPLSALTPQIPNGQFLDIFYFEGFTVVNFFLVALVGVALPHLALYLFLPLEIILLMTTMSLKNKLGIMTVVYGILHILAILFILSIAPIRPLTDILFAAMLTVTTLLVPSDLNIAKKGEVIAVPILPILLMAAFVGLTGVILGLWLDTLEFGLSFGTALALLVTVYFNGYIIVERFILRLILLKKGLLPGDVTQFLEIMASQNIMRRISGGYIFIHRYLLENFASLDEINLLIEQLSEENMRDHAEAALIQIGESAVRPLVQALQTEKLDVRLLIGKILAQIGDSRKGVGTVVHEGIKLPDIDWVEIPEGAFIYGDDNKGSYIVPPAGRQILHLPTFSISRYPVTYAQFQTFLDDPKGFFNPTWWEGFAVEVRLNRRVPGEQYFKFANHPRENVSWYDALAFCRWLSWRLGGEYALDKVLVWKVRLPTEEEWEKAARGTQGLLFPYGNTFDVSKGNTVETKIRQTSAVGIFPQGASPYGVLDMSGNIWEWCLTDEKNKNSYPHKYWVKYYGKLTYALDISQPRIVRGGEWGNFGYYARATSCNWFDPTHRDNTVGFRVAFSIPSTL